MTALSAEFRAARPRPLLVLAAVSALAACAGAPLEVRTWDLRPEPSPPRAEPLGRSLRVDPFAASGGRDAYEVLERHASREISPDPRNRWARRPPVLATAAVLDALRASGAFDVVGTPGEATGEAGLRLSGEVRAFERTPDGAEVALEATLLPVDGRVVPAAPSRVSAVGHATIASEAPEDVARAMEEALAGAAAELTARVIEAASSYRPRDLGTNAAPDGPARLDLVVPEAEVEKLAFRGSARVERMGAPTGLDRLDVLERTAPHRLTPREDLAWTKRPSEFVEDAVTDVLRHAVGPEGRVTRAGSSRLDEIEVGGRLRRFELDRTVAPPEARVELEVTVEGRSTLLGARRAPDGTDPDAVARAFAAAVAEVAAGVVPLVAAATPGGRASLPETSESPAGEASPRGGDEPFERYLVVVPSLPTSAAPPTAPIAGRSLGVARLSGPGGVDRLEVAVRDSGNVASYDPALRWERRPALLVTDGLVRALDASGAFPAGVFGPGAPGEPDLRLSGSVERFDVEEREDGRVAVVSLHLELRHGGDVARFDALASAPVEDDGPSGLAVAMGHALGEALAEAVTTVNREARRLGSDG